MGELRRNSLKARTYTPPFSPLFDTDQTIVKYSCFVNSRIGTTGRRSPMQMRSGKNLKTRTLNNVQSQDMLYTLSLNILYTENGLGLSGQCVTLVEH